MQSIYLDSFVTENAPKPGNKENKQSTKYRKWDPAMVLLLEMGVPFPELVNFAFGYLH